MRRSLAAVGSLIGLAAALVAPAGASAATARNSFDVRGTIFECPTHTYTVTSGTINEVMHESVDANGITHFTVTDTPDRVRLVDEDGNLYSLRGAIWFGGRNDEILTAPTC